MTPAPVALVRKLGAISARVSLAGLLFLAADRSASAQDACFESRVTALDFNDASIFVTADIDGDGDLDLLFGRHTVDQVFVSRNQGNATFAPVEFVYESPDTLSLSDLVAEDFDGDADVDVIVFRKGHPGGGGIGAGGLALLRNDGSGNFTTVPLPGSLALTDPLRVVGADFDGDASPDLLVTTTVGQLSVRLLRNDGTGAFTDAFSTLPVSASPVVAAIGDLDGDGDLDIASLGSALGNEGLYVLSNDGSGAFSILQSYPFASPIALTDLDGDGDLDLLSTEYLPNQSITVRLNSGNGTLSAATIVHDFGTPSVFVPQENYALGDLDLDGDVDFVLPSGTTPSGSPGLLTVFKNLGNATFQSSANLDPGAGWLRWARIGDLDGDSDPDLLVYEGSTPGRVRLHRACTTAGTPICIGDGTGAACPCANHSAPGAKAGCLHSFGGAGTLRGAGMARLTVDTLTLSGTGMTNAAALYFQGTSAVVGGLGTVFGDGLRCAGGLVNRLGVRTNVGGASVFPGPSSPSISLLGNVTTPGERIYQAWYRNSASFCTPDGFNLTNGLRLSWAP